MKLRNLAVGTAVALALVALLGGCSHSSSTAPQANGLPRVAFVYIGPPGDGGWTYQHDQGRLYMEQQLGLKADTVENVPEGADAEHVIADLAQNHDIIFTTSFGYMDATIDVAKKYPKVLFEHCSGYKSAPNVATYFGKNYQASYLAGIVAGKMTKKNLIGYVGAFPTPEVIYNINAYTLGVQSVNSKAKVMVVWSNTWFDPTTERQAAESLLDKGADVLMAYQDSPATLQAAAARGAYSGGNDSNMAKYAPNYYLTNAVWNWGPFYTKIVQSVKDHTWTNTPFVGSMADGTISLAPLGSDVPAPVQKLVAQVQAKIVAGQLHVFTGPITDNTGKVEVKAGQVLPLEAILTMNWFVKGIDGTVPASSK